MAISSNPINSKSDVKKVKNKKAKALLKKATKVKSSNNQLGQKRLKNLKNVTAKITSL